MHKAGVVLPVNIWLGLYVHVTVALGCMFFGCVLDVVYINVLS